jgi:hypothetical protein
LLELLNFYFEHLDLLAVAFALLAKFPRLARAILRKLFELALDLAQRRRIC